MERLKNLLYTILITLTFVTVFTVLVFKYYFPLQIKIASTKFSYFYTYNSRLYSNILGAKALDINSSVDAEESINFQNSAVPILVYHGLPAQKVKSQDTAYNTFKDQMYALKRAGYQTITFEQLDEHIKNKTPVPAKSFILTFDDGIRSTYYGADPILAALDYNAVMYIITGFSLGNDGSEKYYLNKADLQNMLDSGRWEIYSHGEDSHVNIDINNPNINERRYLTNLMWLPNESRFETIDEYENRVKEDLQNAKEQVRSLTGKDVLSFSFPFGDYGQNSANLKGRSAELLGNLALERYPYVLYQVWKSDGFTQHYLSNPTRFLGRIHVETEWTGQHLVEYLQTTSPKSLPLLDTFLKPNGWISVKGNAFNYNGDLVLETTTISTAETLLDGTYSWKNYSYALNVAELTNVASINMMFNFRNINNYFYCSFAKNKISLYEISRSKLILLKSEVVTSDINTETKYAVSTSTGTDYECIMGKNILTYNMGNNKYQGGVGLFIRKDKSDGEATISLDSVLVRQK